MRWPTLVGLALVSCAASSADAQEGAPFATIVSPFVSVTYGARVTFDASRSFDPSGDPLTFSWNIPGVTQASCSTSAVCDIFTAALASGNTFAIYYGNVVVTDDEGERSSAAMQLTVSPATVTTPEPGSLALLGTGFLVVLSVARRKRSG